MKLKTRISAVLVAMTVLTPIFSVVPAADNAIEQTAASTSPESHKHFSDHWSWLQEFHKPAPDVEMGLDLRLREVYAPRFDTLDSHPDVPSDPLNPRSNKWHYERYRMRLFNKFILDDDMDINTSLTWEFYTWDEPGRMPSHTSFDEMIVDRLNLTWRNAFDMPLSLVIGRQDIMLGNGWLVMEATPLDTSRTAFFDAVRATWHLPEKNTDIDLIYINNRAAADARLKPINDREAALTEQDEQGLIIYLADKSRPNTEIDGYFIYKNDKKVNFDKRSSVPSIWSKNAEIYTFGGRVVTAFDENYTYYAEAAAQWGKKSAQSLGAFGANTMLTYDLNDENKNSFRLGYEYLSGDDPSSARNEQFDPLWGEWARWSEIYAVLFSREAIIGEAMNLHRLSAGHSFKLAKNWTVATDYNLLWADEQTNGNAGLLSGQGRFRGQLLTCWLKYRCCPRLNAHFLTEYFQPGDYYKDSNRDNALFLRFSIEYVF